MTRRLLLPVVLVTTALLVSGCGIRGLQTFHLPGGAAGGNAYTVKIIFRDVTALQQQSSVRVNDVPVGDVDKVDVCRAGDASCPSNAEPGTLLALVTARIKKSVKLGSNAVAAIKQTSLLGEKYVEIGTPDGQSSTGSLAPDAVIPEQASRSVPDLEEVFGALSLLLNGGGVEQLQTISVELSAALTGRESNVKGALRQLDTFIGGLDSNKNEIVRALESLNRLSKTLIAQKSNLVTALDDLAPGLKVLADKEPDLAHLLESLAKLGDVASRVIRETKADTIASLRSLDPVLTQLAKAGTYLPQALEVLLDYPFPRNASNGIFGDYTGLLADIDAGESLSLMTALQLNAGQKGKSPNASPAAPKGGPTVPDLDLPLPLPSELPALRGPRVGPGGDGLLGLLMGDLQ
jgi:phospholipid/cholesterol/gamma-HCH transport system substrate-binding protein